MTPGADSSPEPAGPTADVGRLVDHLFRREAGRLVAILARRLGPGSLHLAEDAVQDALARAMETWPFNGIPENPTAWLLQTARNRAFDLLRRDRTSRTKQDQVALMLEGSGDDMSPVPSAQFEDEVVDAQLRMMFVCCHPVLPPEAQIALILKTLSGFSEREIAVALLTTEPAIAKRLVRARATLREAAMDFELPPAPELASRVTSVLHALYLLFNEGYKASHGDTLLREDLCAEAIRLGELLVRQPLGDRPDAHALLALLHFHAARLPTRVADDGSLLVLADQDRSAWDRREISRGVIHLGRAAEGRQLTRWHLEAAIAACHVLPERYADTDWPGILESYDALLELDRSPVIALNRAIAFAHVHGPAAALDQLEVMADDRVLREYHLFHAARGTLLAELGRTDEAAAAFQRAMGYAPQAVERDHLAARLAALTQHR
ncbi:MAG TPA: sigma-70 family RNA polymerase sigma factor [Opitutaceae bacterium]|nr:sigma-70 family RNA polymerase sigma factor [Opitutaceae bacterium]